MKTKKLGSLAVIAAVFAGACADPAGPGGRTLVTGASGALNPVSGYPFPSSNGLPIGDPNDGDGRVNLCKISNLAGTFNFDVGINGAVDGTPDVSITVNAGQEGTRVCANAPLYNSDAGSLAIEFVNIVEVDPGAGSSTTIDIDQYFQPGVSYHANAFLDEFNVSPRTAKVFINDDLEKRVTFTNTLVPPPPPGGCTYTKGWYQNQNGAPTVTAVDGRTKVEAQTILASTPSPNPKQNLGVTWGSDNLLHNLYQQLLTALLNGGAGGPAAVQAAITAAQNGTGGTGLNITTTLTHDEMAALVATLTAFNEGTFPGWPHCPD